ncbi:7S RNA binding protein [Aureococcus anophagefferens]|nr:7S RNA binding protein [Aureococcus anophagefferens]
MAEPVVEYDTYGPPRTSAFASSNPGLSGWLYKSSGGKRTILVKFDRRWFVLDGAVLRYYASDSLETEKGAIPLGDVVEVKTLVQGSATFGTFPPAECRFELVTSARNWVLAVDPKEDINALKKTWVDGISAATGLVPRRSGLSFYAASAGAPARARTAASCICVAEIGPLAGCVVERVSASGRWTTKKTFLRFLVTLASGETLELARGRAEFDRRYHSDDVAEADARHVVNAETRLYAAEDTGATVSQDAEGVEQFLVVVAGGQRLTLAAESKDERAGWLAALLEATTRRDAACGGAPVYLGPDPDPDARATRRPARGALEALAAKLDREGVFAASSDGAKGLLRLLGGGRPSSEDSDDDENDADDRSGALMRRVSRRRTRDDGGDDGLLERPRASTLRSRADTTLTNADAAEAVAAALGAATKARDARPRRRRRAAAPARRPRRRRRCPRCCRPRRRRPPPPPPPPEPKGFTDGEVAPAGEEGRRHARQTWWASAVFDDARRAVEAHLASLEAAFAASSSRVAIKEPNSKRAADELSALDGKRHQSVAIGLRKLRERKLESGAAVAAALDAETLTEEDADAGAGALREGDAWVLDARTACPRLRPRLAVAAAKLSAPLRLLAAAEQTDRRAFAVEAVQHSEPLKDVLKIALLAGNACNHDAKARLAAGVGVAAGLSKLALVKGGKPYKSLVHFVVQCLADDDPRYGGHVAALETLAAVLADVDRDDAATLDELYGDLDGDASTARSEADAADDAALRSWAAWLGDRLADLRARSGRVPLIAKRAFFYA